MGMRLRIVTAALTFGTLAAGLGFAIAAFVIVDQRGAEILRAEPRIRQVEKVHGAPAGTNRTAARRGEKQAAGDARPATNGSAAKTMTVGSAAARPSGPAPREAP